MFGCETCGIFCKDTYDLNRHYATQLHLKKILSLHQELEHVDISKLSVDEEDEYIRNHPYYRNQWASADNYRIKLNEQEKELRYKLGFIYDNHKGWIPISNDEVYSPQEISKIIEQEFPNCDSDDDDNIAEERFKFRCNLEGSRNLSFSEKEQIRNQIDDILEKQNKNSRENLNPKLLAIYKNQARVRIQNEYKQNQIAILKQEEKAKLQAQKELEKAKIKTQKEQEKAILQAKKDEDKAKLREKKLLLKKKLLETQINLMNEDSE